MAYSDYGGRCYRNRIHVHERSDWTLSRDGTNLGTPGMYPGFSAVAKGMSVEDYYKSTESGPSGHVVLGTGPLYAVLHKNYYMTAHHDHREILYYAQDYFGDIDSDGNTDVSRMRFFGQKGPSLTLVVEQENAVTRNQCIYAKLEENDEHGYTLVEWTGWSAYGAGAGLEFEEDYDGPRNTRAYDVRMREMFWGMRKADLDKARAFLRKHDSVEAAIEAAVAAEEYSLIRDLRVNRKHIVGAREDTAQPTDSHSKPAMIRNVLDNIFGSDGDADGDGGGDAET